MLSLLSRSAAILYSLLFFAGCGSPEQYYRLGADTPAPLTAGGLAVGVGPVALPGYVDRAELVFQSSDYRLQVPGKVRWAGSLTENFTRALTTDLAGRLGSGNVVPYPWPPGTPLQRQVSIDVRQFHAVSDGQAILEASWRVEEPASQRVLRRGNARLTERIVGDGYEPVVAAESRIVARLADAMVPSLSARH
jgi:uncharacterized protein